MGVPIEMVEARLWVLRRSSPAGARLVARNRASSGLFARCSCSHVLPGGVRARLVVLFTGAGRSTTKIKDRPALLLYACCNCMYLVCVLYIDRGIASCSRVHPCLASNTGSLDFRGWGAGCAPWVLWARCCERQDLPGLFERQLLPAPVVRGRSTGTTSADSSGCRLLLSNAAAEAWMLVAQRGRPSMSLKVGQIVMLFILPDGKRDNNCSTPEE